MADDLRQRHASSTDSVLQALRAHRRRHQAQTRRLEELRDRLALVVAERQRLLLWMLIGRDDTEEADRG